MRNLLKSIFVLILGLAFLQMQACNENGLTPTIKEKANPLSFSIKDSAQGTTATGDTGYVNQAYMLTGILNLLNVTVDHWQFTWGDNTPNTTGQGPNILAVHKYTNANTYTITLDAWDQNQNHYTYPKQFHVLNYVPNMKPIFKVIYHNQVSTGIWDDTLLFLRRAIQCSPLSAIYEVDTNTSWQPNAMSMTDTTSDGYYKLYKRVNDYQVFNMAYYGVSGSNNCFAQIAPNPPYWTDIYYRTWGTNYYIGVEFIGGLPNTIGVIPPALMPGTVGDSGSTPVMRLGLGATTDTIYVYFCKDRANGISNSFWENNITGINNHESVSDMAAYPNWWSAKFLRSALGNNMALDCLYGTDPGFASMSSSYFWDPSNSWLAVLPGTIGNSKTSLVFQYVNGKVYVQFRGQFVQLK